ncbi:MAG TPA: pyruvate kinase [Candidatus Gastranaerophilaceae bacterium]|nr:pyruvate kinase [Candidatus Gastranaerophilaceae bacterium]HPT41524.1 pyruvate kinase [Candidatus Gastranaerophilaceae bacterium]
MKNFVSTKIISTLGPSSDTKEKIKALVEAGVTMFRLNSSHGDEAQHLRNLGYIREIEQESGQLIPVLLDLQGPKIRVGNFEESIELKNGETIRFRHQENYENGIIPVDYEGISQDVKIGEKILMDDGKLILMVTGIEGDVVITKVICGGLLHQRKGINIPGSTGSIKVLTDKDVEYVKFAIDNDIDYIGLSFVRNAEDINTLKEVIQSHNGKIKIISKIEKPQALKNIDEILLKSSGIIVARGDLGVEISPEKVPVVQKELIRKANAQRKSVIVATQMLESMIENPLPTRAEASDVANAILDGTDAIMLSGETAAGKYPVEAVSMMKSIAQNVENSSLMKHNKYPDDLIDGSTDDSIAICKAVMDMVDKINVKAIMAISESGYTPKLLSKAKPGVPILTICPSKRNSRRMLLYSDVFPVKFDMDESINETNLNLLDGFLIENFKLKTGDKIIFTGAIPRLMAGKTNFIKLHEIS